MNYKREVVVSAIFILFLIFISCTSSQEYQTKLPAKVNPNECRINGTIIGIENNKSDDGPCSIHPCVAFVKINNVVETGFSFRTPIIKGDTIKVKFEYTLSKTSEKIDPTLEISLPGLELGDKFIGDVQKIDLIQLGTENKKFKYIIFNYDKII